METAQKSRLCVRLMCVRNAPEEQSLLEGGEGPADCSRTQPSWRAESVCEHARLRYFCSAHLRWHQITQAGQESPFLGNFESI